MICQTGDHDFRTETGLLNDRHICRKCGWETSEPRPLGQAVNAAATVAVPILAGVAGALLFEAFDGLHDQAP
jgi:hypothetical protein